MPIISTVAGGIPEISLICPRAACAITTPKTTEVLWACSRGYTRSGSHIKLGRAKFTQPKKT